MEALDLSALTFDALLSREWLTVNLLGGYAASTLPSCNTRKYHGLLVAAMAPPVRRMVVLSRVEETVFHDGWPNALACNEYPDTVHPLGHRLLAAFSADPFPRWAYQGNGWTIEKQLRLLQGENTVVLSYTLMASAKPVELELRPLLALRGFHDLMYQWNAPLQAQTISPGHHRVPATLKTPEVFFAHGGEDAGKFNGDGYWYLNTIYRQEQERGYSGLEDLWSPGTVRFTLAPGQTVHFVCSTEPIDLERAVASAERQYEAGAPAVVGDDQAPDENLAALSRAAEQFVLNVPGGRTMLASGYPWSPPSGRDAMINLPGLLLVTGKLAAAREVLEYFASTLDAGLMPCEFPTDGSAPRYTGADVSLWFVHAVREYLRYSGDETTARKLFDAIEQILTHYAQGTAGLGIRCEFDGLLASGSETTATTWMNAHFNEFVVTPRNGRAVEVNALWYNALRIGADLARQFHHPVRAEELFTLANRARLAFNQRFWNPKTGCCFDVVGETDERNDGSIRPNQVFALSLPYPVLNAERHEAVLTRISDALLTPWGVRSLAPGHEDYRGRYGGPVFIRDRAYHQGSAYPWLLGPFVSAYVRIYGRGPIIRQQACRFIQPCLDYLRGTGCGQIHELFGGDNPHHPGGLTASGRSVAEILRAYAEDILDLAPVETYRRVTAAQTAAVSAR
jgi:predicted glycogen debranching enzyme